MIKLSDLIKEIDADVEFISPEETDIDYYADLTKIERESGIHILSNRELTVLAIQNGKVIGALYEGTTGRKFTFDVIVDKLERRKGIGAKLIDYGLSSYRSLPEEYYKLELDVVNPFLIQHLKKRGLKITNKVGDHTIMTF